MLVQKFAQAGYGLSLAVGPQFSLQGVVAAIRPLFRARASVESVHRGPSRARYAKVDPSHPSPPNVGLQGLNGEAIVEVVHSDVLWVAKSLG